MQSTAIDMQSTAIDSSKARVSGFVAPGFEEVRAEFEASGIPADAELAYGDPADEIVKWIQHRGCDLVAMSTHGHRFLADLVLGTTASRVQHRISIPVLLLRAK